MNSKKKLIKPSKIFGFVSQDKIQTEEMEYQFAQGLMIFAIVFEEEKKMVMENQEHLFSKSILRNHSYINGANLT